MLRLMSVFFIRKITSEEKRNIGLAFLKLSPDELQKVLGIVAQADPRFQTKAEVVTIEMDVLVSKDLFYFSHLSCKVERPFTFFFF